MLMGAGRRQRYPVATTETIHNYYEKQVVEEIRRKSERSLTDQDFLADVACVALNRLPPRYIRHDVDMTFFMSTQEMEEIQQKVRKSVSDAMHYVLQRESERRSAAQEDELEEYKSA